MMEIVASTWTKVTRPRCSRCLHGRNARPMRRYVGHCGVNPHWNSLKFHKYDIICKSPTIWRISAEPDEEKIQADNEEYLELSGSIEVRFSCTLHN